MQVEHAKIRHARQISRLALQELPVERFKGIHTFFLIPDYAFTYRKTTRVVVDGNRVIGFLSWVPRTVNAKGMLWFQVVATLALTGFLIWNSFWLLDGLASGELYLIPLVWGILFIYLLLAMLFGYRITVPLSRLDRQLANSSSAVEWPKGSWTVNGAGCLADSALTAKNGGGEESEVVFEKLYRQLFLEANAAQVPMIKSYDYIPTGSGEEQRLKSLGATFLATTPVGQDDSEFCLVSFSAPYAAAVGRADSPPDISTPTT